MKDSHRSTLLEVRDKAGQMLSSMARQALSDAHSVMTRDPDPDPDPAQGQDAQLLLQSQIVIAERFAQQLAAGFDSLLGQTKGETSGPEYSGLSLMDDDKLESTIALEGMITHARNCDITEYLRFTARLNELFSCRVIDESNNPLDPAQIGEAIRTSVEPIRLSPNGQLTVYRQFNKAVFHRLESVLAEANDLLLEKGVLPDLDVRGRDKEEVRTRRCNSRNKSDPNDRAFSTPNSLAPVSAGSQRDVFTLLQSLMHNDVHKVVTSSHIHDSIEATDLLFRAIWEDVTVPEAVRKLIGRTSLTILKTTLNDKKFWDESAHPVRVFLNELAEATSGTSLTAGIEEDPMYQKARDLVVEFVAKNEVADGIANTLLDELSSFKRQCSTPVAMQSAVEPGKHSSVCQKRLEEAQSVANRKIK